MRMTLRGRSKSVGGLAIMHKCCMGGVMQSDEDFVAEMEEALFQPLTQEDIDWVTALGSRLPNILESHAHFAHKDGSDCCWEKPSKNCLKHVCGNRSKFIPETMEFL